MSIVNDLDDGLNTSSLPSLLSTTYLVPAIFLNPILFLHSVNTILTQILPPVNDFSKATWTQPHIDIHANDGLCWSYTMVMVAMQLMVFGSVGGARRKKKDQKAASTCLVVGNGHA